MEPRYLLTKEDIARVLHTMREELEIPMIVIAVKFRIAVNDLIDYEAGTRVPDTSLIVRLLDYYVYHILYKNKGGQRDV